MAEHALKCWPDFFQAVIEGRKTFEVRYDDRGFQAGDTVTLREYDPAKARGWMGNRQDPGYSGREATAVIGYVLHAIPNALGGNFSQPGHNLNGYVVFSLLMVEVFTPKAEKGRLAP